MRVRMSTGGEPRDLQDDLRAAIRGLRLSMDDVAAGGGRLRGLPGCSGS
jgi:hypothetical protein